MSKQTISVRKNKDQTVTIRSGRYVESVSILAKNEKEAFEAVKWGVITAGFGFSEEVAEMVKNELKR